MVQQLHLSWQSLNIRPRHTSCVGLLNLMIIRMKIQPLKFNKNSEIHILSHCYTVYSVSWADLHSHLCEDKKLIIFRQTTMCLLGFSVMRVNDNLGDKRLSSVEFSLYVKRLQEHHASPVAFVYHLLPYFVPSNMNLMNISVDLPGTLKS